MEMKFFYNPVWVESEELISIWCCELPAHIVITSYDQYELYLIDNYKRLAIEAFNKHGEEIYKWYNDFIDENYWYNDPNTLIDCLMKSDKFCYQRSLLKERISENKMPEYIIGSDEAQSLYQYMDLYRLFYLLDNLFF